MHFLTLATWLSALPALASANNTCRSRRPWSTASAPTSTACPASFTSTVTHTASQATILTTVTLPTTSTFIGTASTDDTTTTTTIETTITTTPTTTVTTTVTASSVATSTIPAPSGFLPVQSTLPNSSYSGEEGGSPVAKRNALADDKLSPLAKGEERQPVRRWATSSYPCTYTTTTTTILPTSLKVTKTVTDYSSVVVTSTPVVSGTVTATTTNIITTFAPTQTVTVTTTETTVSSTTVYAACATNNFADVIDGQGIETISSSNRNEHITNVNAASAYDCCALSFSGQYGPGIWWLYGSGSCNLAYEQGGTCSGGQQKNADRASPDGLSGSNGQVVGNGCAGELI